MPRLGQSRIISGIAVAIRGVSWRRAAGKLVYFRARESRDPLRASRDPLRNLRVCRDFSGNIDIHSGKAWNFLGIFLAV